MNSNTEAIQFLNALVGKIQTGIIAFDTEGYVTMINANGLDFLGFKGPAKDIIDSPILDHVPMEKLYKSISICLTVSREDFHLTDIRYLNKYYVVDGVKLLDGMLINISDVTDTILSKVNATRSLLRGIEIERTRLAKEIHDGIGPNMSTIKLQIDAVKRKLDDQIAIKKLELINESISEIATEIRQISHDLMPSSLMDYGVVTALKNFCNRLNDTEQYELTYHIAIEDGVLSKHKELNIYRIVQEIINNAIKYSSCTEITVNITHEKSTIVLQVTDNGIGMELDQKKPGIGLKNIQTRVNLLHGKLLIESSPDQGVSVTIEVPTKK